MPDHRNDEQRRRLTEEYARKTDAEVETLANQGESLTDLAREVLRTEILRRGLNISVSEMSEASGPPPLLRVVRIYRDLPDALVAQSILDSAGIGCFLFDENIVRLNWFYSYAVGEIKLRVVDKDAADSAVLLDAPRVPSFDVEGVGEYIQPVCPNCQSAEVSFRPLTKRLVYALLYFRLPIPLTRPAWRCHSCGYEWRTGDRGNFNRLNWNLIQLLWIIGLAFDFASFMGRYGALSLGFWWASTVISAVCLARYAANRVFTHAFLVGVVVNGWGFFAWEVYTMRLDIGPPKFLYAAILLWSSVFVGILGGIDLIVFTWLARFVVPKQKSSGAA